MKLEAERVFDFQIIRVRDDYPGMINLAIICFEDNNMLRKELGETGLGGGRLLVEEAKGIPYYRLNKIKIRILALL